MKSNSNKFKKKIVVSFSILAGLVLVLIIIFVSYNILFSNKIFYGVKIDNINFSGKNKDEAKDLLDSKTKDFLSKNLKITYQDKEWNLENTNLVEKFENEKTIEQIYSYGRSNNPFNDFVSQVGLFFKPKVFNIQFEFNNDYLNQNISRIKSDTEAPLKESSVEIIDGQVQIKKAQTGVNVDEADLKNKISQNIQNISTDEIQLKTSEVLSAITQKELDKTRQKIEDITAYPITLNYEDKRHQVGSNELAGLIKLTVEPFNWNDLDDENEKYELQNYYIKIAQLDRFQIFNKATINISLDEDKTKNYLSKFADTNINAKAQNATLGINNGQVVVLQAETDGKVLDINYTVEQIEEAMFASGPKDIELQVVEAKAEVRADNLKELGISELIGNGYSNFAGSPQNRIHNITVGANKVNGALVKPGESFSLDTTLGDIGPETGYLPELVIKENKTVPEYGGGLCQVGTTCFRAALNSALPILERQNHAYIVQYYAPTGTDATIYPPHPDVIFKNNTSGYILIQTSISGTKLSFDFYGTKNGNTVKFNGTTDPAGSVSNIESVNPHVYNQQADGSAEAEFYRFIYEGANLAKTERFYSKYDSPNKYPH